MESQDVKRIVETGDAAAFRTLNEEDMESCLIELLYRHFYWMDFQQMNSVQKTIFLCMVLEDHCQADGLLSLTDDENLFFLLPQMKSALLAIEAPATAAALQEFIDFLPEGTFANRCMPEWEWFIEPENSPVFEEIDSRISEYPDGLMRGLYRKFLLSAESAADELLRIQAPQTEGMTNPKEGF